MKYIPYGHQWIDKNDIKEVVEVLKSDLITQGPKIKEFEGALCKYTGAKYAVAVSSGTAALHLACLSVGIKKGDEVITSPITFVASANCVLYCGGRPVFADVQEDTVNIDPEEIKKKITKRTKAIIPVHFAGHPCDLKEIHKTAKEHNLIVIEDACHALGAEYRGVKIGSCKYSDMTVFSFHPAKSITTGEGGAILTNKRDLYEKLSMLRTHGITKNPKRFLNSTKSERSWYYEMQILGFNYRITDLQCALGISQLKKLDSFLKKRREKVSIYNKELSNIEKVGLPIEKENVHSAWHLYPMRLRARGNPEKERNKMFKYLLNKGVCTQVHYIPVHLHPFYRKKFGYAQGDFPLAEKYFRSCLSLPLYPGLDRSNQLKVIYYIRRFLNNGCGIDN